MGKWDYCELSHQAKEHGGPIKYISDIKSASFQEGKESMEGWRIEGITATLALIVIAGKNIYDKVIENNKIKAKGKEAEENLLMYINESDAEVNMNEVTEINQKIENNNVSEEVNE